MGNFTLYVDAYPKNVVPNYANRIRVMLYPKIKEAGYLTNIAYLIPNKEILNDIKNVNAQNFKGIISNWDFKTGFKNGYMLENGVRIKSIASVQRMSKTSNLSVSNGNFLDLPSSTSATTPTTTVVVVSSTSISFNNAMSFYNTYLAGNNYNSGLGGFNPNEYGTNENCSDCMSLQDFFEFLNSISTINSELQSQCLKLNYDSVNIFGGYTGSSGFQKIWSEFAADGSTFHINFKDAASGINGEDSEIGFDPTSHITTFTLNTDILNSCSKEYQSAIMMNSVYQMLHLVDNNPTNDFANTDFIFRSVNALAASLQKMYGSRILVEDSYSLASYVFYEQNRKLTDANFSGRMSANWERIYNGTLYGAYVIPRDASGALEADYNHYSTIGKKYGKNKTKGTNAACN